MKLLHTELDQFRNHRRTAVAWSRNVNVLVGDNGEGKTNVLEAISFLCLTKSFYAANDQTVMQIGADRFGVTGVFESDQGVRYDIRLTYDSAGGVKRVTVNSAPVERLASLVGEFPVVILSPENNAVTFGGPGDRRKFVDLVVSQASRSYFEDLLEYRKVLRQRNRILTDARQTRSDCTPLLEPWDEALVTRGARIVLKRREFADAFRPIVQEQFRGLVGDGEAPDLTYEGCAAAATAPAIEEELRAAVSERRQEERRTGSTLVGPHRDELAFGINGLELRRFASQGQHKTFLVALKLAEFFYLKERCKETPLLLLDDVFSELDEHRSQNLLHRASALGQIFVTATDDRLFRRRGAPGYRRLHVHAGAIDDEETNEGTGDDPGRSPG